MQFKKSLAASLVLMAAQASTMDHLSIDELSQTEVAEESTYNCNNYECQPIATCKTYDEITWDDKTSTRYFNKAEYFAKTAAVKHAEVMEQINNHPGVACQNFVGLEDVFRQATHQSFNKEGDQMPIRTLLSSEIADTVSTDRKKLMHQ